MGKTDILNIQNFKKWILPILMFVFCEFIFKRKILPIFRKFVLTGDYFFDGILFDGLGYIFIICFFKKRIEKESFIFYCNLDFNCNIFICAQEFFNKHFRRS